MAKVKITQALRDQVNSAVRVIEDDKSIGTQIIDAVKQLERVLDNIKAQKSEGKDPTGTSNQLEAALNKNIEYAMERLNSMVGSTEGDDDSGSPDTSTPYSARLTQNHYDVTFQEISSDPNLDNHVLDFYERLNDYVDMEDATAEFTIDFVGGASKLSRTVSGYAITVKLPTTTTSQKIIQLLAPTLVRFYDEMDSDYEADVDEFLMDI